MIFNLYNGIASSIIQSSKTVTGSTTQTTTVTPDTGYQGMASVSITVADADDVLIYNTDKSGSSYTTSSGTSTDYDVKIQCDAQTAGWANGIIATKYLKISGGGITPSGNIQLTQQTGTNVTNYATASVRSGSATPSATYATLSSAGSGATSVESKYFKITPKCSIGTSGWISSISNGTAQNYTIRDGVLSTQITTHATNGIELITTSGWMNATNILRITSSSPAAFYLKDGSNNECKVTFDGHNDRLTLYANAGTIELDDPYGRYVAYNVKNVSADNIKSGVSILGVTGTYGGTAVQVGIAMQQSDRASNPTWTTVAWPIAMSSNTSATGTISYAPNWPDTSGDGGWARAMLVVTGGEPTSYQIYSGGLRYYERIKIPNGFIWLLGLYSKSSYSSVVLKVTVAGTTYTRTINISYSGYID